jgi:arabinose-5-phosphate isomerase
MTAVLDARARAIGVYTDGDLRRSLDQALDLRSVLIDQVMTPGGWSIGPDSLAAESVQLMEAHKVTALLVKNPEGTLVGVVHMHDLLRAGVV